MNAKELLIKHVGGRYKVENEKATIEPIVFEEAKEIQPIPTTKKELSKGLGSKEMDMLAAFIKGGRPLLSNPNLETLMSTKKVPAFTLTQQASYVQGEPKNAKDKLAAMMGVSRSEDFGMFLDNKGEPSKGFINDNYEWVIFEADLPKEYTDNPESFKLVNRNMTAAVVNLDKAIRLARVENKAIKSLQEAVLDKDLVEEVEKELAIKKDDDVILIIEGEVINE